MSTSLVQVVITLTKGTSTPTPTGVASAGTSVVVTGPDGIAQAAVVLTGNESPPWSFTTSVAPGSSTAVASDMDTAGTVLGTPITQSFTEVGAAGTDFLPTTGITVVPSSGGIATPSSKRR